MTQEDNMTDTQIDTANKFWIGKQGNMIVSRMLNREFTEEEALNLAAWLVVMVGDEARFDAVREAITHT